MSTQPPDPRTLRSWEDAFTSTSIANIRVLERQIRHDISTNRERLRSLVGNSYRDLLSTASTITSMDRRMKSIESTLSTDITRKCNNSLLDRTKVRSKALLDQARAPETDAFALASQLSVFRACPGVIARIMKGREASLLAAAKVLVIYRVLYTEKLKGSRRFEGEIQATFRRLGPMRDRLLAAIDAVIARIEDQTPEKLLDAMCAYALATSSSAADILRHFHHVRATAISSALRSSPSNPVLALQIWIQTLKTTQSLFPRPLVTALTQLKSRPLLASEDLTSIPSFNLDVHLSWLGEDIKGYVPYVRADDLDLGTAKKQLASWAPATLKSYLADLQTSLESEIGISNLARLRRECLIAWFTGCSRIAGVPRSDVLQGLRSTFSSQLARLTEARVGSLSSLSAQIQSAITSADQTSLRKYAPDLWDPAMLQTDTSSTSSKSLTSTLLASVSGRSRAIDSILQSYSSWLQSIEAVQKAIDEQRKIRWQDLNDDYDEESDEEEVRDQALSREDPDELRAKLVAAVHAALDGIQETLAEMAGRIEESDGESVKAAFSIRLVREFEAALPALYTKTFALETREKLHKQIARPIVDAVMHKHGTRIGKSLQSEQLAVRKLWSEGMGVPILPSPWAFRLLHTCHGAMGAAGQDLWTKKAVAVLKSGLGRELEETLASAKGTVEEKEMDEKLKEHCVQQVFDVRYLAMALGTGNAGGPSNFGQHLEWLEKVAELGKEQRDQVFKGSSDYWTRTSLLFALLS